MQLQLFYNPAEDRLLLALAFPQRNVAFWLTRRMTALLWQALWKRAGSSLDTNASSLAKEWLLRLKQDRARQKQEVSRQPLLQPSVPPVLATTVRFGPGKRGGHALSLLDAQGKGERMTLDDDGLYALIRLLDETLTSSEWRLDLWRPRGPAEETGSVSQALH